MGNVLVAYFSATGTTKRLAEKVAETVGGELFEIRPREPYTAADLDWRDGESRSSIEMGDASSRPEIEEVPDLSPYDTVFIGFPIWWYTAPHVVWSFVEKASLAGKTVVTFATSGSSAMGGATADLSALNNDGARWVDGKVLNGAGDAQISAWVKGLDL